MNREPIALYIFRYLIGLILFSLMLMLYWSSTLLEDELHETQSELSEIKNDLFATRQEIQKTREDLLAYLLNQDQKESNRISSVNEENSNHSTPHLLQKRKNISSQNKNLLTPDPFYYKTLPTLIGTKFIPQGVRKNALVGRPHSLHPLSNWSTVNQLWNRCLGHVSQSTTGFYERMSPDLAIKLESKENQDGIPEYWVHLRDDLYWQPLSKKLFPEDMILAPQFLRKHPVTSYDFKFYFDAVMNPYIQESGAASLRNYLGDIKEIKVIDEQTFVVRWHSKEVECKPKIKYTAKLLTGSLKPLPRWVYQYFPDGSKIIEDDSDPETYRNNSVWAQNFTEHWAKNIIISCGPWIFDGMGEKSITLKRNNDFYNPLAVLFKGMETKLRDNPDAIWQDFKAGDIDSYDLRPDQLIEVEEFLESDTYKKQKNKIKRLDFLNRAYVYIGWNQNNPFFSSKKVRQAMTMAIDRNRIIEQNLNHMGVEITGPFFRNSPSYDSTIDAWPYDPQRSRQLLEEEGWFDSIGNGIRDKIIDGKKIPFRFSLTYYVKNPTSKANSEYIKGALREVGVDCELNGVDLADLSALFDEKSFEAIHLGWGLGSPPEEPKQIWHSSGALEKGSSNAVGFANQEADEIIEKLQYEYEKEERLKLYHRFHAIIHEEAPYTFLYTPKSVLLYRDYVKNVFIPSENQAIIPGANVAEPISTIWWLDTKDF
jgi:peptide/nickel transport system substrate-binding protein